MVLASVPAAAGTPGFLVVDAVEEVEVFVDGELRGVTVPDEVFVVALPPGEYELLTQKDGYHDEESLVTIRSAESTTVRLELEPVDVQDAVLDVDAARLERPRTPDGCGPYHPFYRWRGLPGL